MSNVTGVDEYPEWIASVITNENGSIKDPMGKAGYLFVFDIAICSLALLTNLYFGLVILCNIRLRNQPKYVMKFITTTVCSLLTLFTDGQEAIYFIWPSEQLCKSFVFTLGWFGEILLFNILLALIEQFVAFSKPKLYNEKVTPLLVVVLSALINFLFIVFIDWVFVFGVEQIQCAYSKKHVLTLMITWILLLFSCAALAISTYVKTKPIPVDELTNDLAQEEALDLQKKMESARQIATGFIPILILFFLSKFISLSTYLCSLLYAPDSSTCSTLVLISSYDNKLFPLCSLISPLIGICTHQLFYSPLLKCFKPRRRPLSHSDIIAIIRLNNLMKSTAV